MHSARRRRHLLSIVVAIVVTGVVTGVGTAAGAADEIDAVDSITTGADFHEPHADILRLYYAIFDRAPDLGGALYWIDRFNEGESIHRIALYMSSSPEFIERYGDTTDERYVSALYRNVLDREPDAAGFAFWTHGLATGGFDRLEVLRHFSASSEFVSTHQFVGEDQAIPGPPLHRPVGTGGPIIGVSVEIEGGLSFDLENTRREIVNILADSRGWTSKGTIRFRLLDDPAAADVRVRIASPRTVDARCSPLRTGGRLSCRNGNSLHLNSVRWSGATSFWTAPLSEYRAYLINHEMGHFLGHGHRSCPARGAVAPVMQQQTKSLQGCRPNGWPYP